MFESMSVGKTSSVGSFKLEFFKNILRSRQPWVYENLRRKDIDENIKADQKKYLRPELSLAVTDIHSVDVKDSNLYIS